MEALSFNLHSHRLLQELKYQTRYIYRQKLGWQGLLGLLLIIANLAYMLFVVLPINNQIHQLQKEKTTTRITANKLEIGLKGNESQSNLVGFYAALPKTDEANIKVSEILAMATSIGLQVNQVEYAKEIEGSSLEKLQVKLPITGNYLQIRQYMNAVLNAMPSMAISFISLNREDITNDAVNARIHFTLYLHKEQ